MTQAAVPLPVWSRHPYPESPLHVVPCIGGVVDASPLLLCRPRPVTHLLIEEMIPAAEPFRSGCGLVETPRHALTMSMGFLAQTITGISTLTHTCREEHVACRGRPRSSREDVVVLLAATKQFPIRNMDVRAGSVRDTQLYVLLCVRVAI